MRGVQQYLGIIVEMPVTKKFKDIYFTEMSWVIKFKVP